MAFFILTRFALVKYSRAFVARYVLPPWPQDRFMSLTLAQVIKSYDSPFYPQSNVLCVALY